jgi:crotonobetainyl-CoA:carnitine CoA-transferase CaiB-like acyl-CoA transferase
LTQAPVLDGLKVLDLSHQYAGALAACLLSDLGADVVAVEHPEGSPIRTMLPSKDGESLWWKVVSRGKRVITLDISHPQGREILLEMLPRFDVVVENFRPGTLERWQLGPTELGAARPGLVLLRISGFGQTGPLRDNPGFGTVAEAMSGFAHLNGMADGPPVFPATTLADGVAGTFGALGVLAALRNSELHPGGDVEVVDVALFEPLFRLIPTQIQSYDQLGQVQLRPGNFMGEYGILRNLYRTLDGDYVCVSAVGEVPIRRVLDACGVTDLIPQLPDVLKSTAAEDFKTFLVKADTRIQEWIATRSWSAVALALKTAGVVFQRIYDAQDIVTDPHYLAREDVIAVDDARLQSIRMPGVVPKFPLHTHRVQFAGAGIGEHNRQVYVEMLGLSQARLEQLAHDQVI